MRSRRALLGTAAASAGLLAGCIGQLGSDDDGSSEDEPRGREDLESWEEPHTGIYVWSDQVRIGQPDTYDVEVSGDPNGAARIEYRIGGSHAFTMHEDTSNPTTIARGTEEGQNVEAIAVYETGETELISERCISC